MEKFYSVNEAAALLRLSHWTIWSWLKTGKLRGSKVGGRRVIRESELQRLIVDDAPIAPLSGRKAAKH